MSRNEIRDTINAPFFWPFQGAGIPPSFLPVTHDSLRLIDQTKTICEQRIYLDEAKELFSLISSKFLLVGAKLIAIFLFISIIIFTSRSVMS